MNATSIIRGIKATRRGVALAFFVLLLVTTGIAHAEKNSVIFQSTETPPYWSASLPENGLGGAILRLLSASAGVPYSIEYLPVKRFRNSLATYIVGDPDILITKSHRAIFPIGIFSAAFFYYKPHHEMIDVKDVRGLRGLTLGVLRGTLEDRAYFERKGIAVEESNSVESLLRMLKRGRIDFCIVVAGTGRYTIEQQFPKEQENFIQVIIPETQRPIAIMIDMTTPEGRTVAQRYRQVLKKTLRSQDYHDLLENYFGKKNIPDDQFEQLDRFIATYAATWGD